MRIADAPSDNATSSSFVGDAPVNCRGEKFWTTRSSTCFRSGRVTTRIGLAIFPHFSVRGTISLGGLHNGFMYPVSPEITPLARRPSMPPMPAPSPVRHSRHTPRARAGGPSPRLDPGARGETRDADDSMNVGGKRTRTTVEPSRLYLEHPSLRVVVARRGSRY